MRSSGRYSLTPELWRDVRVAIFPHLQRNADPLKDVSGGGFDLSLDATNPPSWVPGDFGPVLSFDGANDKAIFQSGSSTSVGSGNQYTISVWIRTTSSGNSTSYGEGLSTDQAPLVSVEMAAGALRIIHRDDAGSLSFASSSNGNDDGLWHLHTVTRDGNDLRNYVDGVLDGAATGSFGSTTIDNIRYGLITLGGVDGNFWSGDLGSCTTWSRVLLPQEIQQLHRDPYAMLRPLRRKALLAPITLPPPSEGQPFRMRGMMVPGFAGGRFGRVA